MSDWTKNLISYTTKNEKGCCPHCNSANIKVESFTIDKHTSLDFTCGHCGKSAHFDGTAKA